MPLQRTSGQEWKSGWTLVLASSIGFSFFSVMLGSVGLFMEPLERDFGWSRTMLSSGPSIATIVMAVLGPFFGMLVDRRGTRRLTIGGLALTIGTMASFSLLDGSVQMWVALWLLFGAVAVSIKSTAWTTAVVGVFTTSRGLALAVTLGGSALSSTLVPPLGNFLIETVGWRSTFVWLGVGWGSISLILALLFFHDVNDDVRNRVRKAKAAGAPVPDAARLPGLTVHQAVRDPALIRVAVSNFIVMLLAMGLAVHLFQILREAGVSRTDAAWLTSLGGLAGIVGKLLTGYLLDRFRPNWIGGLTMGAAAVTATLLIDGISSPTAIVVAILVNGYTAGTKAQITGFLTAGYAGMKNFGTIYGFMSAMMAFASGLGPLTAGILYDVAGNYTPFLIAVAVGCTIGGILIGTLPRYPVFEDEAPSPRPT